MSKGYKLNVAESNVVDKLTTNAKMDWLFIEDDGRCRDLENNRIISAHRAIKTLMEGLVEENYDNLTHDESIIFLNLVGKLI